MTIDDATFVPLVRAYLEAADGLGHFHDRTRLGGSLADRKIAARRDLYEYLVARGWTPPPDVSTGLLVDRIVTDLSEGAIASADGVSA